MLEARAPNGRTFYRRDFRKDDGRTLALYGYEPPKERLNVDSLGGAGPGAFLRWHPLLGEWSVYAAHRQNRTFMPTAADDPLAPTAPGGSVTEIEVPDFELAVFQNRFASLHPEASVPDAPQHVSVASAKGDCEVVVFTPEHEGNLATLTKERRELLIAAWIDRYDHHFAKGADYVLPFESRGREVGVTLDHPHGQIYAFPFVPGAQRRMAEAFASGFTLHDKLQDWEGDYGVMACGPLLAFVPPFARYPYEVWIASRNVVRGPWDYGSEAFESYAELLGRLTAAYDRLFSRPAATLMSLQASPRQHTDHFEFTTQFFSLLRSSDKVKYLASVEQATGVFTVDVMPEQAAAALRKCL